LGAWGNTDTAARVVIDAPYPGHESTFELHAELPVGADVSVVLDQAIGPHWEGPYPPQISLATPAGIVVANGTAGELLGKPAPVGKSSGAVTLRGALQLPYEAGDELQGQSLELTFRLVAEQKSPGGPGVHSGGFRAESAVGWALLGISVAGLVALLILKLRKDKP
jgi:hypothetical protein